MKHWFYRIIFLIGTFAVVANADTLTAYTISFTGSVNVPTAGSFIWDSTNQTFAAFSVTWNGLVFDLFGNQLQADNTTWCGLSAAQNSIFLLLTTPGGFCGPGQAGPGWTADSESYGNFFGFYDTDAAGDSTMYDLTSQVVGGQPVENLNGQFVGGFSTALAPTSAPEPSSRLLTLAGGFMLFAGKRGKHPVERRTRE